jgi:hypothetical protein
MNKQKGATEAPQTTEAVTAPVTTPATTPTPAPAPTGKVHTKAELMAALQAGTATQHVDDGSREAAKGFTKLMAQFPGDKDAFYRDANGRLFVFRLIGEDKYAFLRRSAGPSKGWFVVRTSDVHQQRFLKTEKPAGASAGGLAPVDVALPE